MCQEIKEYVRACPASNQSKKSARYGHAGGFLGSPAKVIQGNDEHIFMMAVDQFTKWVECIPLPSQTANEMARAAVREFFSRFGYPSRYLPIRVGILRAASSRALLIHKAKTAPYRTSANDRQRGIIALSWMR